MNAHVEDGNIVLNPVPDKDIPKGLMVEWDRDTSTLYEWAHADIIAGVATYSLPHEEDRRVAAVYLKIN